MKTISTALSTIRDSLPLIFFVLVLALCNLHLLVGAPPSLFIYRGDLVASGQWWRIFTHVFTHVSWYHLLLDASAVVIIWRELPATTWRKLSAAAFCAATALLAAILLSPDISHTGYCGLSGMAHGLMTWLGTCWILMAMKKGNGKPDKLQFVIGLAVFLIILGKSLSEVATGHLLFQSLHPAHLGVPIVHAHLGGVIGGILFSIFHAWPNASASGLVCMPESRRGGCKQAVRL